MLRLSTWFLGHDPTRIGAAIADCRQADMWPLVIVRDVGELRDLGAVLTGCDVELGNEPDGNVDQHVDPYTYAEWARNAVPLCMEIGCQPWVGAISNLNTSGLNWLEMMLSQLGPVPLLGISAHIYEPPQWGRFLRLIGNRRWVITEFGYHTGKQPPRWRWLPKWWPGNCATYTDADVFRLAKMRRDEIANWGAEWAVYYQYPDGLTNGDQDRFGIRRCDPTTGELTTWKPVADLAR